MTASCSAWTSMIGVMLALGACADPHDGSEGAPFVTGGDGGLEVLSSALTAGDASQHPYMIGDVIDNAGYSYLIDRSQNVSYVGSHGWLTCPTEHSLIGYVFNENGFWLCARPDLASRTFYVGDVELNHSHYYRLNSSGVTQLPSENWNTCVNGSSYLGRRFDETGFWVCVSPQ
jgi:hypothetical protein